MDGASKSGLLDLLGSDTMADKAHRWALGNGTADFRKAQTGRRSRRSARQNTQGGGDQHGARPGLFFQSPPIPF